MTNIAANENPGAAATATGANSHKKVSSFRRSQYTKAERRAITRYGKREHKSISRALYYALTEGSTSSWYDLTVVLYARLGVKERAALAYIALLALDRDTAWKTADAALNGPDRRAAS